MNNDALASSGLTAAEPLDHTWKVNFRIENSLTERPVVVLRSLERIARPAKGRRGLAARPATLRSGLAVAAALLVANGARAESPSVDSIFSPFSTAGQPGCAVGVFDQGAPILVKGYGAADLRSGRPIDGDTVFYAGSMSKQFVGLAVAKLVETGKVSLDDPLQRWIPEFPRYERPITLAMLLHHTSGIRDLMFLAMLGGRNPSELTRTEVLEQLAGQRATNFTPGTRFSYTNSGYFLLTEVVARASGVSFEDYVQKALLKPLDMNNTYVVPAPPPKGALLAIGYWREGDAFVDRGDVPRIAVSGGVMTSVNDLAKFDHDFQVGHRIWTPRTLDMLTTPGTLDDGTKVEMPGEGLYYAGGLMVGRRAGQTWVTHDGAMGGYRTDYVRLPDLRFGVAVLCNRSDSRAVTKTMDVIRAYRGGEFDRPDIGGVPPSSRPTPTTAVPDTLAADVVGEYRSAELGATYIIRKGGSGLNIAIRPDGSSILNETLVPSLAMSEPDVLRSGPVSLKLERAPSGAVSGFVLSSERAANISFVRTGA